jgi:hypothetical protein
MATLENGTQGLRQVLHVSRGSKMFHLTLKLQISGKCCIVPCNIRKYIYKPTAKTVGGPSTGDLQMKDLNRR